MRHTPRYATPDVVMQRRVRRAATTHAAQPSQGVAPASDRAMTVMLANESTLKNQVALHLRTIRALEEQLAARPVATIPDAAPDQSMSRLDLARSRCAAVTAEIARGLEERDDLLDYIFAQCPNDPVVRVRLPRTRRSCIRKLRIGAKRDPAFCSTCGQSMPGHVSAHLFVGFYESGDPGELFIAMGRGHRDAVAGGGYHLAAKMASLALQHHAPAPALIRQMRHQHDGSGGKPFGPDGPISGPTVTSLTDYIGVQMQQMIEDGNGPTTDAARPVVALAHEELP